jgi:iron complex outermembrane receptor protein
MAFLRLLSFFFLLFSTLLASEVPAQTPQTKPGKITGKVVDPEGNGMEYVTVALYVLNDSVPVNGTSTNEKGEFTLEDAAPGRYYLLISFIGTESVKVEDILVDGDLPHYRLKKPVVLGDRNIKLDEVVVTGNKDVLQYGIDKKIYSPDQDLISKGGTATDLLQNVPSVQIDAERNLQFRGSSNVTVYIDGKPSTLTGADRTAVLDQIPAENIERIEIISNPSAKFDAEGSAGIINIVTKKGKSDGYNGTVTLNAGSNDKYQGNLLINVKKGKFNFGASYGFNQQHNWSRSSLYREMDGPLYQSLLNQSEKGFGKAFHHTGRINADYIIRDFETIGLTAGINAGNRSELENIHYLFYHTGAAEDSSSYRESQENRQSANRDFSISYRKGSKTPDKYLNADFGYSGSADLETMDAVQPSYYPGGSLIRKAERQSTLLDRSFGLWTMQVDKSDPLGEKAKLETGLKATIRNIDNDFLFERMDTASGERYPDPGLSNRFIYNEQVYAAYASYSKSYRRLGYSGGLRLEHTVLSGRQAAGEAFHRNYLRLFPSAYLSYKLNDREELQLNYSRRINRPGIFQLNPFINFSDPLNLRKGNPQLNPEFTGSYELNYVHQGKNYSFSGGVYWKKTTGQIIRYRTITPEGITLTSFENLDDSRSAGIEAVGQYSPYKWWRMTVNANFYQIDMKDLQLFYFEKRTGYTAKLQLLPAGVGAPGNNFRLSGSRYCNQTGSF